MEHLLRHGLYALLQLPNSTFLDLSDLLRRKTDDSERLRKEILEVVDNQTAYQFWKNDFDRYSNEALDPPKHKLSKLLVSGTVSLMLSQPENMIDFRQIMDNGMILLVNLSTIGSEVREILGCFILSLFHLTALGRSETPIKDRKPFHIYTDEAHRFVTEAMEDLIAETRKRGRPHPGTPLFKPVQHQRGGCPFQRRHHHHHECRHQRCPAPVQGPPGTRSI